VDVTSFFEFRHISIKLQGAITQTTAIFKQKKIYKIKYVTLKVGDVFIPQFKEDIHSFRAETNSPQFCI
jgi:hypothetical protein